MRAFALLPSPFLGPASWAPVQTELHRNGRGSRILDVKAPLAGGAGAYERVAPSWDRWFGPGVLESLLPDVRMRETLLAALPRTPLSFLEEPAPPSPGPEPSICAYLQLSEA